MLYHFDDNITVSTLTESEYPLWDAFVRQSPQGTFFNQTEWALMLREIFGREFRIIVCKRGDSIDAGMLLFEHKKLKHNLVTAIPFYPFSGPLFYRPEGEKSQRTVSNRLKLSTALNSVLNQEYAIWRISTHQAHKDMRGYLWQGAVVSPSYTYIVNLDAQADVRGQYSQSLRRKLKQVDAECIKTEPIPAAQTLLNLYYQSYERHDLRPPMNEVQAVRFMHVLLKNPHTRVYYYQGETEILAMRIMLLSGKTAYDLMAGSNDPQGIAAFALVDRALNDFSGRATQFDFLGADHPEIEKFKRSFGGTLTVRYAIGNRPKFPYSAALSWRERRNRKGRTL